MNDVMVELTNSHLIFLERYKKVVITYLFSLMIAAPKHTLTEASFRGQLHKSQYSRLLSKHPELAKESLKTISQKVALEETVARKPLISGAPWSVAIIIDSTLHGRATLHTDNSQRLNHGEGFVVGHQWTNIILLINKKVIPLPPIAFLSKKKCKDLGVTYMTEHERIIAYLKNLVLEEWVGPCRSDEVVVLMDGGYDDCAIQDAVLEREWDLVGALKKNRGVQSISTTSYQFKSVERLFKDTKRQSPWKTVCIKTSGKKKRRRFRARQIQGNLKGLKDRSVTLVCSENSKGKKRLHLLSTNVNVSLSHIISAYNLRWKIELFHKDVKSYLGMEDFGGHHFASQESHVLWVYTAYLLLMEMDYEGAGIQERQRELLRRIKAENDGGELKKIIQMSTRFGGATQVKKYCEGILAVGNL